MRVPAQHPANKTALLVRNNDLKALSHFNLIHNLHPAYFRNRETWQTLEQFFLAHTNYAPEAKPYDVLTVFVNRYMPVPVKLSDKELLEIKPLYDNVAGDAPELGQKLGQSILVDAYQWRRGKKIRCDAPIADCYLSHGIVQDRASQWVVAAGKTPGLTWISSCYRRVFRSGKSKHTEREDNSLRKALGPRKFLRALGAEIAPRLVRLSEKQSLPYPLFVLQQDAINKLQQKPTHLEGDSISPDLQAVVDNICRARKKAERKERGIALFEAISYSWDRLYSDAVSCSSVYYHRRWKPAGKIPSSWIAGLAQQPWLMNLKNEPKAPKALAIRTSATQAIYGDAPKLFAIGLGNEHSSTGFPAALKMETNPRASSIVEQILRMRDGLDDFDSMRLRQLYLSLADMAQRLKSHFNSDTPVDDLTVGRLRTYFGEGSRGKGLLHVNGDWATPEKVFWGRNVFHGRRLFAPTVKKLEPLWRVLGLQQPDFTECIKVLYEIAKRPLESTDEAVLIDTYRLLNTLTGNLAKSGKRQLRELPLWCNSRWVKSRPVFIVNDDHIQKCLAQVMPVWTPPLLLRINAQAS